MAPPSEPSSGTWGRPTALILPQGSCPSAAPDASDFMDLESCFPGMQHPVGHALSHQLTSVVVPPSILGLQCSQSFPGLSGPLEIHLLAYRWLTAPKSPVLLWLRAWKDPHIHQNPDLNPLQLWPPDPLTHIDTWVQPLMTLPKWTQWSQGT